MNNAPDNLDLATRDRVDMLVSRITDAEAGTQDWAAFSDLAERHPWAWLIKRVFLVDVTECPDCGRKMKWMEACTEKRDIHRVLAAHGLTPRAPPPGAMAPLGQLRFTF